MKLKLLSILFCGGLLSAAAFAENECTNTCEQDYKDCKTAAESNTQKQACEDDVKECKAVCDKPL